MTLASLKAEAADCRNCPLWKSATQTVFGEGRRDARVMLIGEQPGDQEDRQGRPFVGPAGQLLGRALTDAGLEHADIYVTNAVKHFKWEPRGKRRIHKKPNAMEVDACRFWLESEIQVLQPDIIVCLGATAAQALLGRKFRVTLDRGKPIPSKFAPYVLTTVHPSSLLRAADDETRRIETAKFVDDLRRVRAILKSLPHKAA